jgi:isopentenyldiphosphate isomerase
MELPDNLTNKEMLEVVDNDDEVIGLETRKKIHKKGLWHREAHVWFYTPQGEIIFQHRAKDKETYPDLLDATVGGHVEPGHSYLETAVKETEEETGVAVKPENLVLITKFKTESYDEVTKLHNNAFKTEFAYCYKGNVNDLKVEDNQGLGFEAWPVDTLLSLSDKDKVHFISGIINSSKFLGVFREIKKLTFNT